MLASSRVSEITTLGAILMDWHDLVPNNFSCGMACTWDLITLYLESEWNSHPFQPWLQGGCGKFGPSGLKSLACMENVHIPVLLLEPRDGPECMALWYEYVNCLQKRGKIYQKAIPKEKICIPCWEYCFTFLFPVTNVPGCHFPWEKKVQDYGEGLFLIFNIIKWAVRHAGSFVPKKHQYGPPHYPKTLILPARNFLANLSRQFQCSNCFLCLWPNSVCTNCSFQPRPRKVGVTHSWDLE